MNLDSISNLTFRDFTRAQERVTNEGISEERALSEEVDRVKRSSTPAQLGKRFGDSDTPLPEELRPYAASTTEQLLNPEYQDQMLTAISKFV